MDKKKEDNPMNSIANDTVKELYFTEEDLKERLSEISLLQILSKIGKI